MLRMAVRAATRESECEGSPNDQLRALDEGSELGSRSRKDSPRRLDDATTARRRPLRAAHVGSAAAPAPWRLELEDISRARWRFPTSSCQPTVHFLLDLLRCLTFRGILCAPPCATCP
jgi:hypothetical protein